MMAERRQLSGAEYPGRRGRGPPHPPLCQAAGHIQAALIRRPRCPPKGDKEIDKFLHK